MSFKSTTDNPPNPVLAHAGNKPDSGFFDSLAETVNAAHRYNSLFIYSQGFQDAALVGYYPLNSSSQVMVHFPVLTSSHSQVHVSLRAICTNPASNGQVNIAIIDQGGQTIGSSVTSVLTSSNLYEETITLTRSLVKNDTVLTFTIGTNPISSGQKVSVTDVSASWVPLTASAASFSAFQNGNRPIVPLGTGIVSNGEPLSAAVGWALASTINTLLDRPRVIASVSGSRYTSSSNNDTDVQYIEPFVRCHLARVTDTRQKMKISYYVRAHNSGSSSHNFVIKLFDPRTLFGYTGPEPNFMDAQQSRGEVITVAVAAGTDLVYNGSVEIERPFDTIGFDLPDCCFIAVAVATRAMLPRSPFGLGSHNDDLKIRSYSIWME